jgi:predicted XRE-type DNA-binding protein
MRILVYYAMLDKALWWLGSRRDDIRAFPEDARMKLKVTRSSGNVFKDLGFPEEDAEHLRVRADLLIQIQTALDARGLKQAEAAKLLGVTQPRVSDLVRGRLDLFSVDSLIDMLAKLGLQVRLVVAPSKKRRRVA